jgi:hypothetical protein
MQGNWVRLSSQGQLNEVGDKPVSPEQKNGTGASACRKCLPSHGARHSGKSDGVPPPPLQVLLLPSHLNLNSLAREQQQTSGHSLGLLSVSTDGAEVLSVSALKTDLKEQVITETCKSANN